MVAVRVGGVREVGKSLALLGLLDFITTYEGVRRGLRELNPLINHLGLWVYPALLIAAFLACIVLDAIASRLNALVRPSRIIIAFYAVTVANNVAAIHVWTS